MVDNKIQIGMIGYNEGNGHPYSFSAIINGYDKTEMAKGPYPVISDYLNKRTDSEFGVGNFHVSHIWTPYEDISKSIAKCTYIETICTEYEDMLGEVEAVIIARDDAHSHREIAEKFLDQKVPVFIDKPLCKNLEDLLFFEPYLRSGQLMSCSGFRYFPINVNRFHGELEPDQILFSHSVSTLDWYKYGIHVLEGLVPVMGADIAWVQDMGEPGNHIVRIGFSSGKYAMIIVNHELRSGFYTDYFLNEAKQFRVHYNDNFACFKGLLVAFYEQVTTKSLAFDPNETITLMKCLIGAEISLKENNRKVHLVEIGTTNYA